MNLQGRELRQGLSGPDVARLHETLFLLGYEVTEAERGDTRFGDVTLEAVREVQAEIGIAVTGEIDETGAKALRELLRRRTWVISGKVMAPGHAAVGRLSVEIVDKNVGRDAPVASGETDSAGAYRISAVIPPGVLRGRHKSAPDLQALVSSPAAGAAATGVLAVSDVAYDAPHVVTLDIALPAGSTGLPSEYESLLAAVGQLYGGDLSALQENAQRQDLTYLANKTGWDARAIAMVALAAQLSESAVAAAPETKTPAKAKTRAKAAPPVRLAPSFYYALLRAGAPANPAQLFQTSAPSTLDIWTQASGQGVIPQASADEISAAAQTFQTLAGSQLLSAPSAGGAVLADQVSSVLTRPAQQRQFAALLTQFSGDWDQFWPAVQTTFGKSAGTKLQTLGQLNYLTLNNIDLTAKLLAAAPAKAAAGDLSSLALRGFYDPAAWTSLIGETVPAGVPGATPAEQAGNYAALLAAQVKLAYPTAALADQVAKRVVPVTGGPAVAREVSEFLQANQADFSIGVEPVEAFLIRAAGVARPSDGAVAQIKRLQRVYQLTTSDQTMALLLDHNLDSAYAITRYDQAGFARAFGPKLGGAEAALAIHARARQTFSTVLNLAASYGLAQRTPALSRNVALGAKASGQDMSAARAVALNAEASTQEMSAAEATLQSLFGSLAFCSCSDCSSILSPAAYFVDLLHYLDQPAPAAGDNPQAVLFDRRPDLQNLALSCANTNTSLPYIDLVNETLEALVAGNLGLTGYPGFNTSDDITSAQLIAAPQNINDAAYDALAAAVFPSPLPFNRPLELLRRHMSALGVSLPQALEVLRASETVVDPAASSTATTYAWSDILIERLGMSRGEARVFTDSTLRLGDLWGLPRAAAATDAQWDAASLTTLQGLSLQGLSARTGASYAALTATLKSRFINPGSALIPRLEGLGIGLATIAALATNPALAAQIGQTLPAGLDYSQYGGATDGPSVVAWLVDPTNFNAVMDLIVIVNPNGGADDCSGAALSLQFASGDPLAAADYVRLIRFIRLWRKLQATLGLTDDAMAIQATDALLSGLYPAGPATSEAGFATALQRAGFLVDLLRRLQLDAGSLTQLLACWAPLDTAGSPSLYASLFLTPTLLQQAQGAQIGTVSPLVEVGDVYTTTIDTLPIDAPAVVAGDTPQSVATAIAATINGTATPDPVSHAPLNQRFRAVADNGRVVITAGFILKWTTAGPAGGTLTAAVVGDPTNQAATIGGAPAAGQTFSVAIDTIPAIYVAQAGDSVAAVAAGLAAAVNAQTTSHPYSNAPLNTLLVASAAGAALTVRTAGAGPSFDLSCDLTSAEATGYAVGAPTPAQATIALSGAAAAGDTVTLTLNGMAFPPAPVTSNNLTALAASLAHLIDSAAMLDPATGLPFGDLLTATSAGPTVTIVPTDPSTAFSVAAAASGAEGLAVTGPSPAFQMATVTGAYPAGTVLTTQINGASLYYTVAAGDTAATIAGAIATQISASTLADPATGAALNALVSATAAAGTITVTALNTTTAFTLQASAPQAGYAAGRLPAPFADNGYGVFLNDPSQTLIIQEPLVCAACNLTGAEFADIAAALGFDATTPLSLDTVSQVFRYGWLPHALGISVPEFLALRQLSGLDPFAPLDPVAAAPAEPQAVRFVRLVDALNRAGLAPSQALYLIWNGDPSGTQGPAAEAAATLAQALRADFAAIEAQFTLQDDPSGAIAQQLMSLVYGATDTAFFFSLLNQTFSVAVACPYAQPSLPAAMVAASSGLLAFDDTAKTLSYRGWLTDTAPLVAAAGGDLVLTTAVSALAAASQQVVNPFFAKYPELRPLLATYAAATGPAQDRRTALLQGILPTLVKLRKAEQALAEISGQVGCDPSLAQALLRDALILHADGDATQPAEVDLMGIEAGGLTAAFYLGDDLTAPPDRVIPAVAPVAYDVQTLALGGAIPAGATVTATVDGVEVTYEIDAAADTDLSQLALHLAQAINTSTAAPPAPSPSVSALVSAVALGATLSLTPLQPLSGNGVLSLAFACTDPALTLTLAGPLPLGPGGAAIAARWSGWLTPPQSGNYDICVVAGDGAEVSLIIDDVVTPLSPSSGGFQTNLNAIALQVGQLTKIVLEVTSVKSAVMLGWNGAPGSGWTPIPASALFPAQAMSALGATYVRFLKSVSLGSALSLTADELAWLGTDTSRMVETTSASKLTPPGPGGVFTPASMANIATGSVLVVDSGAAQETVTVSGADKTTFTADTTQPHDGSTTPFAIVSPTQPLLNGGWLNSLAGQPGAAPTAAAQLTDALTGVLAFARLKKALSPKDQRLLDMMQAPTGLLATGQSALISLTGWAEVSAEALLLRFFGAADFTPLGTVSNLARVFDAMSLVKKCRVTAQALLAATTNAPTAATVSGLQSALRASYAAGDWLGVLKPINDPLRRLQRDALVAWILQALYVADPAANPARTADDLYADLLIDPSTEPAVLTSRIRLALSSVQLFIERVVRALEAQVSPADIDRAQWDWMKRYRVWEANREVFLWPENWLDPALRDDASPIFDQVMSSLLQSDITDDSASAAYLDYLSGLADVAKLEPCGLYFLPGTADDDEAAYVVARSFGAHRKYYFRQLQGGSWSPWRQVNVDCEDMPLTPIVWKGRLFLFWLKVLKDSAGALSDASGAVTSQTAPIDGGTANSMLKSGSAAVQTVKIQATLWWTEYYNGKWQPTKSSDPNRPTAIGAYAPSGPEAFEAFRNQVRIVPATYTGAYAFHGVFDQKSALPIPNDALILAISTPQTPFPLWDDTRPPYEIKGRLFGRGHRGEAPGFLLHNTHSLPTPLDDLPVEVKQGFGPLNLGAYLDVPSPYRDFGPPTGSASKPNTGAAAAGVLTLRFFDAASAIETATPASQASVLSYQWQPRIIDVQPGLVDAWTAPFLYEDRRNLFYVTTTLGQTTFRLPRRPLPKRPPVKQPVVTVPPREIDPIAVTTFVVANGAPRRTGVDIEGGLPVTFKGTRIFAGGSDFAAPATAADTAQAQPESGS